jgi:hypothetical protein
MFPHGLRDAAEWWFFMMRRASIEVSLTMVHVISRWLPEPWRLMAWLRVLLS